ncbi:TetR/AcrR family transcriptional regulator [Flavilitoribacter nigricans]|uniref:HTH tetR-type domain-containing protein n=1 Tax=Flavilitoribacter nigricans (strain ATCC 23147 / DSM 23189 / NBRC 102662 / NCIMB 1420 / SS-2) TaxID=1122177 RepID=A0A2D0MX70_FLAN2|nr:TetR/AcrR family transcriptional regulator [Flavilitoribacter nigricans]PHN00736.1 hypothetical protein CRP01_40680 [Flavilitoribacter nigricans DSM 23189 = NBRC 102662]
MHSIARKVEILFWINGIKAVTMDKIAQECRISKKTIYKLFGNKESMVQRIYSHVLDRIRQQQESIFRNSVDAIDELLQSTHLFSDLKAHFSKAVFDDLEVQYPDSYRQLIHFRDEFLFAFFRNNLERGITEGIYRHGINTELMARHQTMNAWLYWREDVYPAEKYSTEELRQQLLRSQLYGLVSDKGKKLLQKNCNSN